MTGRRLLWAVLILASAVLYFYTRTAASLLLLSAALLLPGVSLILVILSAKRVAAWLKIPAALQKNAPVRCELRLKNRSFVPLGRVDVLITVRNALTCREERFTASLPAAPFEEKEIVFNFESAHCGQFVFSLDSLLLYDILGLRAMRVKAGTKEKRSVPPHTFSLQAALAGGEIAGGGGESISLALKGQDRTEPFQIREYIEGDSPKQIHWKLSQKFGRYLVADPSLELEQALLILWDSGPLTKDLPANVPDALAEAILSLGISLAENSIPYSAMWKNTDSGEIVLKEVSAMDDVYEVIPGILGAGAGGGLSLIPEFLHTLSERRYPLIAYFSCAAPKELDELALMGEVTAFLCQENAAADDGSAADAYKRRVFTPCNYQSVLGDAAI